MVVGLCSCDKTVNENAGYVQDFCKATGLRKLNGRKENNKKCGFTCITAQGSSVVD